MNIRELKQYVKMHKIKYREISDKSGIPIGTLRNIFSNAKIDPRCSTIEKIEIALAINNSPTIAQDYYSAEEQSIVKKFRSLSERDKKIISDVLKNMTENI